MTLEEMAEKQRTGNLPTWQFITLFPKLLRIAIAVKDKGEHNGVDEYCELCTALQDAERDDE